MVKVKHSEEDSEEIKNSALIKYKDRMNETVTLGNVGDFQTEADDTN